MNDQRDMLDKIEIYRSFDLYKRYIDQENNLLNQRITWLLLVQGFLLATFATILTKKDAHLVQSLMAGGYLVDSLVLILALICVCLIGILFSWISRKSIQAAVSAQKNLKEMWEQNFLAVATLHKLPHVVGGGKKGNDEAGNSFGNKLPVRCVIMWGLFLIVLLAALAGLGAVHFYQESLPIFLSNLV